MVPVVFLERHWLSGKQLTSSKSKMKKINLRIFQGVNFSKVKI